MFFTVQWLIQLPPQKLAKKISNEQWRFVVEQLVKSQQPADRLLRLIKQAIDQSVTQEPTIQEFLHWLLLESDSLQTNYKPEVVRASYYALSIDLATGRDLPIGLDLSLNRALDRNHSLDLDRASTCTVDYGYALDHMLELNLPVNLNFRLRQLKEEMPTSDSSIENQRWWPLHGTKWIDQLRQVVLDFRRDAGNNWRCAREKRAQLWNYYEANKFLVNLMKLEGAVSNECRTEIEKGLLLPWAELQRSQPYLYGELVK